VSTILEYKCPACGGAVEFNSSSQNMKCPYCDTEFDIAALKESQEAEQAQPDVMTWENTAGSAWEGTDAQGMGVYSCQSCGGEIVADETTAASSCPYCDNPIIMTGQLSGVLKPDYIIPFKLDKAAAKEALMKHLKGKFLLPKVFKDENHIDEIKGVYVPFWLFDADAHANIRYEGKKIRRWSDSNYNYKEISVYALLRDGDLSFSHVPVDGSSKMADDLMESVEPFDHSAAVSFETAYLSGYLADKYDVTAEESVERANQRIRESTEEAFEKTTQEYSEVRAVRTNIRLSNGQAKYALYPVWILNTNWRGEKYVFAMNGQTGKFVGNLPTDKSLFWKMFGIIAAGASVATYVIAALVNAL